MVFVVVTVWIAGWLLWCFLATWLVMPAPFAYFWPQWTHGVLLIVVLAFAVAVVVVDVSVAGGGHWLISCRSTGQLLRLGSFVDIVERNFGHMQWFWMLVASCLLFAGCLLWVGGLCLQVCASSVCSWCRLRASLWMGVCICLTLLLGWCWWCWVRASGSWQFPP